MAETVRLLEDNRKHLEAVAEALIGKERMTEGELRKILPEARKGGAPD